MLNSHSGSPAVETNSLKTPGYPLLSLFSGAGGMDLGFSWAGFKPALCVDKEDAAVATLKHNFPNSNVAQLDIAKTTGQELADLLPAGSKIRGVIGGPPCQGFSNGNVAKKRRDPRNRLPFEYARLLEELGALYDLEFFAFENVMGLLQKRQKSRFARIKREFRKRGFHLSVFTVNAADHGVAQVRRRLFIVGFKGRNVELRVPESTQPERYIRDVIGELPEPSFFRRGSEQPVNEYHCNHWTMMPRSRRFETQEFNRWRSFRRLEWDRQSPTVAYGNREIHVHPDGKRRLSILEAMLLQGFPSSFQLCGNLSQQVTQVSNAVPPPVACAVAKAIRSHILVTPGSHPLDKAG